ncbi:uncharacterized protein LODBEIA_P08200 [Lodderomyces beijingensis]|uniref:MICOS complex subunit MIC60 n=1 Tax=Lodderomyces beijingensis TaxID=1775926 RepID=A0ABP0ZEL4_9ASCO
MIRIAACRVRVKPSGLRGFSTTVARFNGKKVEGPPRIPELKKEAPLVTPPSIEPIPIQEEIIVEEPIPKKKKKFSLFGFLFKTSLLAVAVYGGTLYVATKNDKVMDFVIDNNLPYHEELIEYIDTTSWDDIEETWHELKRKFSGVKVPSKKDLEQITTKLEHKGEDLYKETKRKLAGKSAERKGTELTPAEQLQKPVEVESVTREVSRLPLIELSSDVANSVDSSVKQIISSLNNFIQTIDAGTLASSNTGLVKAIDSSLNELAKKLNSLTTAFDEEVKNKLKASQTELVSSYTKKELDLTENLVKQFNAEKAQLEKKLNQRLEHEVQAAREAIGQAATNAVSMVRIEQTNSFEKLVSEKINEERSGRLANLEKLNEKILELEKFADSFQDQIIKTHERTLIQRSVSNLKSLLLSSSDLSQPKNIQPYVDILAQISTDDEVLNLALKDLQPLIAKDSTHSILSNAQLLERFQLLAPDLRSSSLLPPNAGLLGHLSSLIFSKLLLPVKGVKADGKDIESVIGRIESSLARGELDIAVEEATNLKGWTRRLANDWVEQARKRLEVEFLLGLIETEARIL